MSEQDRELAAEFLHPACFFNDKNLLSSVVGDQATTLDYKVSFSCNFSQYFGKAASTAELTFLLQKNCHYMSRLIKLIFHCMPETRNGCHGKSNLCI